MGTVVLTVKPIEDYERQGYGWRRHLTDEQKAAQRWGVVGRIIGQNGYHDDSHYIVAHYDDQTEALYKVSDVKTTHLVGNGPHQALSDWLEPAEAEGVKTALRARVFTQAESFDDLLVALEDERRKTVDRETRKIMEKWGPYFTDRKAAVIKAALMTALPGPDEKHASKAEVVRRLADVGMGTSITQALALLPQLVRVGEVGAVTLRTYAAQSRIRNSTGRTKITATGWRRVE